jgi:hypothetical protein
MTETILDNAGKPARVSGRWPVKRERIGPPACPVMHRWTLVSIGRRPINGEDEPPVTAWRITLGTLPLVSARRRDGDKTSRAGKLLMHHFLPGSEDMSIHDHPSPFWTLVLWGGYDDIELCPDCHGNPMPGGGLCRLGCVMNRACGMGECDCRCRGAGEVVGDRMRAGMLRRRSAFHRHRTRTLPSGAWTLVLMRRKERQWGFWNAGRWWPWRAHEKAFGMGMRCAADGER